MSKEKYDLEVGKEGLDYDILDKSFNPTTQAFILAAGLKPGMKVLDIGCGAGIMSAWLAKQVGPKGSVMAIDNSEEQLNFARKNFQKLNMNNIQTQVLSIYDIEQLKEQYDLIYCRFVLHHVYSPRKAIALFHENLNKGGIYIGEEGIVSAAFAYPPSFAWQGYMPVLPMPSEINEGHERDGDFGMKLFYSTKAAGFEIIDCKLVQPVLWRKDDKQGLLSGLEAYKKTDLEQGTSEADWQKKYDETKRLIADDKQMIGFYGSCQVAGRK